MVADADAPDISEDVADLAIVEPTSFTAARNARAKELRAAKERDRAALVAKLPKPSWTAWALNVLARQEPEVVTSWLAAGDALDDALGAGDREVLRDAQRDERAGLAATIERANQTLVGAGRKADDQTTPKLTGTLRAAVTDASVRDALIRGVLVDDVDTPTFGFGFGSGSDADVVSLDSARAKRSAREARSASTTKPAERAAVAKKAGRGKRAAATGDEDDAAEAERRAAEEAEAEARRVEAERLAAERDRLAEELRAREEELSARAADAEEAEAAAATARATADAATAAVEAARAAVVDARAALDALPEG